MVDETLQRHFNLLQQEFQKLNNKYQALKLKHNDLTSSANLSSNENNFSSNLLRIIKSLHKDKKYSDISIKLQKTSLPGHKLVLEAHSTEWGLSDLGLLNEIDLQDVDQLIGNQVVKWLYTQELKDNQKTEDLWKIVEVAQRFGLTVLKARCKDSLMSKTTTKNCIYFYKKSCELEVEGLQKYCMDLIIANWTEYDACDFNTLDASVFLELLEAQSCYPLHFAVKYNRDDVVFVYINDHFSQLEEVVNVVSASNEIVLDLALMSQREELCRTLINNCANLNIVDNFGWSLLHKAIQRRDAFSTKFLVENGCHLNPLSPDLFQTPLQLIARMKPADESASILENMNAVASLMITSGANVSHSDSNDMTAISLAVLSGNEPVLRAVLNTGRFTDINGTNTYYNNKTKTVGNSPQVSRTTPPGIIAPHPLWLAACREYRQEFLHKYNDFSEASVMPTSPTLLLLEHRADPSSLYDLESGNSVLLEIISQHMEDAATFILEIVQKMSSSTVSCDKKSQIECLVACTNNAKETALHIAVENELSNLCGMLLTLGADPNAVRRRLVQSPSGTLGNDSEDSLESINSISSNHIASETSKWESQDSESANSSHSYKCADLNPFKEFMLPDTDVDHASLSNSLPLIRKQHLMRSSLFESVVNKNQHKDHSSFSTTKTTVRTKSRRMTTDISVDLCSATHLAIMSRDMNIIALFIDHDGVDGKPINWLLCNYKEESPFTLSLWNGLITVADKIFGKMTRRGINATKIDDISVGENRLMHIAVLRNNIEAVQFLIKIGCKINIRSLNGSTPLQLAIDKGNLNVVRILCLAGADPNESYKSNLSDLHKNLICPLWAALNYCRFDIAEILAESGSDVDMWSVDPKDGYDQTLLHKAIIEGNEISAIFLINRDCDINSPRESKESPSITNERESLKEFADGSTPLHLACQLGLKLIVHHLLSKKDIIVDAQNAHGSTTLHVAIKYEQEAIVSMLLDPKLKSNLSLRDNEGHTAFHVAMAMSNQVVASSILLLQPSAADEVDNMGRNFLHVAVQTMNREAMFFLIQINVNLNVRVKDCLQHTPLQLAVIAAAPEDMIRSLILAGAAVEDVTVEKYNVLHLAVVHERAYLINCLVENGASLSQQDHNFDTPLHLAMKIGNKDVIEQLLRRSSKNVRLKNLRGENILHVLANNAKENGVVIFSLLMDLFSDFPIDDPDAVKNTALFLSVLGGHSKLAVAMLMKGASLGCVNNDGMTLFNCAKVSERILYALLDSLDNEPSWCDGEICVSCLFKFSMTNRRHHCRHCGRLICAKCSSNEIPIVRFNITKPVRVCDSCFNFIVNGKIK